MPLLVGEELEVDFSETLVVGGSFIIVDLRYSTSSYAPRATDLDKLPSSVQVADLTFSFGISVLERALEGLDGVERLFAVVGYDLEVARQAAFYQTHPVLALLELGPILRHDNVVVILDEALELRLVMGTP
jgi:hypothetical protein